MTVTAEDRSTRARPPRLTDGKRIVVKIGSALLVDPADGRLRTAWLDALAEDIAEARARGQDVLIVTSGAVAAGREHLGLTGRALKLEEKQAAAAAGNIRLANAYQQVLEPRGLTAALILLTPDDTEVRRRHLNARATLSTLLKLGVVPIINENDTVSTAELRFGDNDRLAARVAQMVSADMLVLLSDVDGLYTADPRVNADAEHIPLVSEVSPAIESFAGKALPGYSSGGMVTKLAAAKIALAAGCAMAITRGQAMHALRGLEKSEAEGGKRATWFLPSAEPKTARKKWIAGHLQPAGSLTVDAGAVSALAQGRSLLPAGVTALSGGFERGDLLIVCDETGREIARGLAAYSAHEAARIIGRHSSEIEHVLGFKGREELIHRDDLVLARA
jgi:glutamate 5-kinase